jgi:hypothetical protein
MAICSFVDCSKPLSKKNLETTKGINFDCRKYYFCEKHFHKITGMIVEMKMKINKINKSLKQ